MNQLQRKNEKRPKRGKNKGNDGLIWKNPDSKAKLLKTRKLNHIKRKIPNNISLENLSLYSHAFLTPNIF
jgi:hypothetical protein